MAFIEAVRTQRKLRLAIFGVSGSGKTTTAMRLAQRLAKRIADREGREPRVGVIDTENGSVSILVGAEYDGTKFKFKTSMLKDFSPTAYTNEIKAAGRAGFDALIIDSLSHAWAGKGGALELKDRAAEASSSGNSFTAWRTVTPMHNDLIETMIHSSCHIFATMRSHQEYVQDKDERGKTVVRKIGLKPVQREGMEYEFDVVLDIDENHIAKVSKTRCDPIDGMTVVKPDGEFMDVIAEWLETGDDIPEEVIEAAKMMESRPSVGAATLPGTGPNGAAKEETAKERLDRLKAEKAKKDAEAAATKATAPAAASTPPLVSSSPAKTNGTKPSIKPLQAKPIVAAPTAPVETPTTPAPAATPEPALTREGDQQAANVPPAVDVANVTDATNTKPAPHPYMPITDADLPPVTASGPFDLASADKSLLATDRQCEVLLAMYSALGLGPETIEAACQRRSPTNGKTVYDTCQAGADHMMNAARAKMMSDKPDWPEWLAKINEQGLAAWEAAKDVPF